MTHQAHPSVVREVVQVLAEHGFDGMAQAMELFINECMKIERQQALGAGPYQRSPARRGQANGFKPKRLKRRITAKSASSLAAARSPPKNSPPPKT